MRCVWCHNPESWSRRPEPMFRVNRCLQCGQCVQLCPQHAVQFAGSLPQTNGDKCTRCGTCIPTCPGQAREIAGRTVTVEEVITEIAKDRVFYEESGGGVTFSGGEPLMQPDFLLDLLTHCRQQGIHTAIDTCCFAPSAVLEKVIPAADLFLCDVKHINADKHKQYTGVENRLILENLRLLTDADCPVIVRIPVVPGFNDTPEEITEIISYLKSLNNIHQIDLLPYNSGGVSKAQRLGKPGMIIKEQRPSETVMRTLAGCVRECGFKTTTGG